MEQDASDSTALTPQQRVIFELARSGRGAVESLDVGRGEHRHRCLGLVTENIDACLERAAARGLHGGHFALMGLRSVVYWPDVPTPA
jgi:hypothetical protein